MRDQEIIQLFNTNKGKNQAFNLLLDLYQERTYWHIRKLVIDHNDADDICQEVFIKVFKKLNSFKQDSQLFTWIFRIATNESLNFLQKKKRRFFVPLVDYDATLLSKLNDSELVDGDRIELALQQAILKLPEKQRVVFNLKYFDELDYQSISEITNTSVGALKASYHHAVEKIKKFITLD